MTAKRREPPAQPAGLPPGAAGGVGGRRRRAERAAPRERPARVAAAAMPGPLGLLCFLALGLRCSAEPSGAAPPLCAAPCSCDGDRRVDCSGKGLTAVPEGLSAFTQLL